MRALLALLCVAAIAALGFLFLNPDREAPDTSGALHQSATPDATSSDARAASELAAAPVQERDAQRSAVEARASAPTPGASAPSASRASAHVVGRVLDARGRPLQGADVRRAEATLLGATTRHPDDAPSVDATTTGADGRFDLAVGGGDRVALRFGADGCEWLRRSVTLAAGATVDLGDLQLADGVQLSGRVVDSLGQPVSGARITRPRDGGDVIVFFGDEEQGEHLATSGADGAFAVRRHPAGAWTLTASHARHPRTTLEGEALRSGERREGLVVTMADGVSVAGFVNDLPADGRRFSVRAQPIGARDESPRLRFGDVERGLTTGGRTAEVRADGSFEVEGLPPAEAYRLAVHVGPKGGARQSEFVTVAAGSRGARLAFALGSTVTLRVVDAATKAPVERFGVESGFGWLHRRVGEGDALHHADGVLRLEDLWRPSETSRLGITISASGYASFERSDIEVTPGSTTDLGVIELTPVPVVEVSVIDQRGDPVEGASVVLTEVQRLTGGNRNIKVNRRVERTASGSGGPATTSGRTTMSFGALQEQGRTNADGVAVLNSVPGKTAQVTVAAKGFADWISGELALPTGGTTGVDAVLNQGGQVLVRVLDRAGAPAPGVKVERRTTPGHTPFENVEGVEAQRTRVTDALGEARFDYVAVGRQGFRVAPKAGEGMTFVMAGMPGQEEDDWTELDVDEGGEHTLSLALPVTATLVGRVYEDGQPLAGARVRKADSGGLGAAFALIDGGGGGATTDGSGRFRFENLDLGDLRVQVEHPSRAMPASFDLALEEGESEVRLDLTVSVVEGRVTDAAGKPVAGAKVTAERHEAGEGRRDVRVMIAFNPTDGESSNMAILGLGGLAPEVRTDAEGRYSLRGVAPDVELVVKAEREGFREAKSQPLHVTPGAVRSQIDLVLEAGGALRVICDAPGQWLAIASASGGGLGGGAPKVEHLVDGVATFEDLTPGSWSVRLDAVGGEDEAPEVQPQSAEVKSGETAELRFEL